MPKESSLHSSITFPNNNHLWLNNDYLTLVFPQGVSYRVQSRSDVIALGIESNLRRGKNEKYEKNVRNLISCNSNLNGKK